MKKTEAVSIGAVHTHTHTHTSNLIKEIENISIIKSSNRSL